MVDEHVEPKHGPDDDAIYHEPPKFPIWPTHRCRVTTSLELSDAACGKRDWQPSAMAAFAARMVTHRCELLSRKRWGVAPSLQLLREDPNDYQIVVSSSRKQSSPSKRRRRSAMLEGPA